MKKYMLIILILLIVSGVIFYCMLYLNKNQNKSENDMYAKQENAIDQNTQNTLNTIIKEGDEDMKICIKVNHTNLTATLWDNSSSKALIEKLKEGPITIDMQDYSNFEKVGALGFSLPTNDTRITTKPGDIILYQGNQLTIYYDTNTWNFTKLGEINDITQEKLKDILGKEDVTIELSL